MRRLKPQAEIAAPDESDLTVLLTRREGLRARHLSAQATSAAATLIRRTLLVENDSPSPAELTDADRACRDAADTEGAIADALMEIDGRISGIEARISKQRVVEGRRRDADELDSAADEMDLILGRVAGLAEQIDRERRALLAITSRKAVSCYDPPFRFGIGRPIYLTALSFDSTGHEMKEALEPQAVASRLVGHLLAPVLPTLGIADMHQASAPHLQDTSTPVLGPIEDVVASKVLITDHMRELAGRIRSGTDIPEPKAADILIRSVNVFVTEPCFYTDSAAIPADTFLSAWFNVVPNPVADRLFELGLCHGAESPEAERQAEAKRERDARPGVIDTTEPLNRKNCQDIGLDLAAWRSTELEARRAAWRAGLPN